ncbi:putative porin [Parathalassolituus penaei]|uniref:Porin n=1 Tax=Parathalassolituus penaei TaxID=2997323 RepID=A0A9X3ITX3_9GAMM|nr:putative porin [Parathalassolituus penaei]MCY0967326.1 putative porin [Parathalassolituus penaei]
MSLSRISVLALLCAAATPALAWQYEVAAGVAKTTSSDTDLDGLSSIAGVHYRFNDTGNTSGPLAERDFLSPSSYLELVIGNDDRDEQIYNQSASTDSDVYNLGGAWLLADGATLVGLQYGGTRSTVEIPIWSDEYRYKDRSLEVNVVHYLASNWSVSALYRQTSAEVTYIESGYHYEPIDMDTNTVGVATQVLMPLQDGQSLALSASVEHSVQSADDEDDTSANLWDAAARYYLNTQLGLGLDLTKSSDADDDSSLTLSVNNYFTSNWWVELGYGKGISGSDARIIELSSGLQF